MAAGLAAYRGARVFGVDRLSIRPGALDELPLTASLDGDAPDLGRQLAEAAGSWGIDWLDVAAAHRRIEDGTTNGQYLLSVT